LVNAIAASLVSPAARLSINLDEPSFVTCLYSELRPLSSFFVVVGGFVSGKFCPRREADMPFFNEASRIYNPLEVNFMRSCFGNAAIMLEESDQDYSASELASCIIMLYESGLRDHAYLSELSARLAHQRYLKRHDIEPHQAANSNGIAPRAPAHTAEYDPFA
jgi:hypothetical protein